MAKLLSLYIAAILVFCGLAFVGLSAIQQPTQRGSAEPSVENENVSRQYAECVFAALRNQEAALQADRERFIREASGTPLYVLEAMARMMPPPPSATEMEIAKNQNMLRIKQLCRLKLSFSKQ